jgi:hypothetical protein
MEQIIDILYEKRFCLQSSVNKQTDIIKTDKVFQNNCLCGNFNHIACIFRGNNINKSNILSIGCNRIGDIYGNEPGEHAEENALNKIKSLKINKNPQIINLLVIRLSKQKKLQNSKPCVNCIRIMKNLPNKKGYKIKNIYYSTEYNNIIKIKLRNLENEPPHYTMYYKRKMSLI